MLAVLAPACASRQPRVNYVQQVNQSLQGNWLLQSYRPFTTLEPPLAAVVGFQLGKLRITISGAQILAQGPGVQLTRTYQIIEADDEGATLQVSDGLGSTVRLWVGIQGAILTFRPLDAPAWNGEGTMSRL
jgi:hypothetical protein